MSSNKREREESVEAEPLDLTMKKRKSPVSIVHGLKKTTTTVLDEATEKPILKKKRLVVEDPGVKYPIDIWFLIANYIDPEDVGTFARICKDTLFVIDSGVFWSRLYKRYCEPGTSLTDSQKPNPLKGLFGLRTRVIKALHSMYKPLMVKRETSLKNPILRNTVVLRQWGQNNNARNQWIYYFELRDTRYKRRMIPKSLDELLRDITVNPAEGCVLLKVTCPKQISVPLVVGLALREIKMYKFQEKLYHMKISFHFMKDKKIIVLCLDIGPVVRTEVVNWWNPCYPHFVPCPYILFQAN